MDFDDVVRHHQAMVFGLAYHTLRNAALAEEIAQMILAEFAVEWVRLSLNKPGAIRGSRDVGVMIERTRADLRPPSARSRGA